MHSLIQLLLGYNYDNEDKQKGKRKLKVEVVFETTRYPLKFSNSPQCISPILGTLHVSINLNTTFIDFD